MILQHTLGQSKTIGLGLNEVTRKLLMRKPLLPHTRTVNIVRLLSDGGRGK